MPFPFARPGAAVAAFRPFAQLAVATITSLAIVSATAADLPLSFAETLRIAVDQSAQLVSQRAMVDAAREMTGPAGELPDPKLKLGVDNVPTNGPDSWSLTRDFMTMSKIGVMQEFPREEKRRLRSQRAENDAQRGSVPGLMERPVQQWAVVWLAAAAVGVVVQCWTLRGSRAATPKPAEEPKARPNKPEVPTPPDKGPVEPPT